MASTIIFHACGGTGINLADQVMSKIDSLGVGFCEVKYHYLDTSRANIDRINPKGEFFQVRSITNSKAEITGSGSERAAYAADILDNVNKYLDTNKYLSLTNREHLHVVAFSASGASGSTSGVFLCRSLLARDIPVVALVVGDSSNQLYCKNTINTLAGLDKFARENNKALSIIYINNHSLVRDGVGLNTAEKEANEKLTNILTSLSLFWCNGNKKDIDDQDMINIILPSNYKSISIKPGLYGIMFFSKEIKAVEGSLPVLGRSLSKLGGDCAIEINLLHHKSGFITAEPILEVVKEENLPLHMISFGNFFIAENKKLQELYAHYENAANAISNEQLVGCNDSSIDETGLIL